MDDARNAPIVSPADAEDFFATGCNALTGERSPITVDVPGVGATPAHELLSLDPGSGMMQTPMGDTPLDLARDRALKELAFAALALAAVNLLDSALNGGRAWCRECQCAEFQGQKIEHLTWCKTGRVLKALEYLKLPADSIAREVGAQ